MKNLTFKNKTVLITGSSCGIGKATALEFCRLGAQVMLNGRDAIILEKWRQCLADQSFDVAACAADVTDFAECERLIQITLDRFGKLDLVIANASVSMRAKFAEISPEVFEQVILSNILGPAFTARAALDAISASRGSIIFIGSVAGFIGLPSTSAYSAGKMALTALCDSLRAEMTDTGVHCGIVYVGFTENDPNKRVLSSDGMLVPVAQRSKKIQQSQEQVARAIVRLTAERKSKIVLSTLGKLTVWLNRFFPRMVRWAIKQSLRKFGKMYS